MKRSTFLTAISYLLFAWMILGIPMVTSVHAEKGKSTDKKGRSILQEVLTLNDVARLLRVRPESVARMASRHRIPGRLIDGHWRFSRLAILNWLGEPRPLSAETQSSKSEKHPMSHLHTPRSSRPQPNQPMHPVTERHTLPEADLNEIAGKGTNPNSGEEPEQIGEKSAVPTAEEVSLRGQQVLLNPQQLTLELDFSFTRSEQTGLTVVPIGPNTFLGNSIGEQDLFIWSFTARYGLPHDFLLVASLPLIHDRQSFLASVPGSSIVNETSNSLTETGDFFLGLRHTTIKEGSGYPEVILSVNTLFPTRKSSFGLGGGIALIKRLDPVALFANLDYVHVFSREFQDVTRLRSADVFNMNFGYAFSMNESLALSTSVLGTFTTRTTFDNPMLPSLRAAERFFLRASLTALLTEKLFVEPFVTFALNGSDIVTLGLNIPYTFDVGPYMDKMFN